MFDKSMTTKMRAATAWALAATLAAATGAARAATVYFEEDFPGAAPDPTVWDVSPNGAGNTVTVTGSWIHVGAGNTLDAPYVRTAVGVNPFPTSGDFSVEIRFQYLQFAGKGTGLLLLDESARSMAGFWADGWSGIQGYLGSDNLFLSRPQDTDPHVLRWEFSGGQVTMYFDGLLRGSAPVVGRPEAIWFGHPTLGQQHSVDRAYDRSKVDSSGKVTARWWGSGDWTDLAIDSIRVEVAAVPLPAAAWLFGSGLFGLIAVARRRH